jgi:hypothetical protein
MRLRPSFRGGGLGVAAVAGGISLLSSCAKGETTGDTGGAAETDAATSGDAPAPRDSAPPPPSDSGPQPDASEQDSGGCSKKILINEIATHGTTASIGFVELYNPNTCAVSLAGWKLAYKSKANNAGPDLYDFAQGDAIPAKTYFVLGTSGFAGKKDITLTNNGMADDGQVGLIDDTKKLVDGVGLGGATGDYVEGASAPAQTSNGGSVARIPNATDTNNNKNDFQTATTHTAGAAN